MEKVMLSFDKVSAHYGKIQALHEVSLHINQGEIVTLIGANGAGKTTLLGTLCGDPRATSGRIVFDDKDITDWQTAKIMREAVAIVPEGRRVFSRMTVEENLAMGGFFAERDQFQERIKWVYELFPRLHERRVQRAGTMSGGEQQMLAIGRALMSNPRLLLLDEPSLGLAPIIIQQIFDTIEQLREQGAEIIEVDCPHFDDALAAYYLIMPCEVSSNLARFDGMRYGLRAGDDGSHSAEQVMSQSRAEGFGPEVKRRIMLGTYALSVGYYDAYYLQAQRVRTLIAQDFARAFEQVDVLVSPTTPTTAFKLGEKAEDPMAMYNFDLCTLPLNLAGLCGMSVPSGLASDTNLPTGLQIMAPAFEDDRLYKVGAAYEAGRDK